MLVARPRCVPLPPRPHQRETTRRGGASNLYVREDVMVDVIRGLLPGRSAGWTCLQMVQHLRRHRLVVSCAEFACSLEPMFPA
ncbi:hypothetical protein [Dactylosporangium cerinum]